SRRESSPWRHCRGSRTGSSTGGVSQTSSSRRVWRNDRQDGPSGWQTTFGRFRAFTRTASDRKQMAVRIRLSDGSAFVVDAPFQKLQKAVVSAVEESVPFIEVMNGNGQMRSINPRLITSLEEIDDESLTPGEKQVLA